MKKHLGTPLRLTAGVIFLVLGVIGAVLPVMQGWIFFLLAALMFFPNHPRAEKGLARMEHHAPKLVARLRRAGFGRPEGELANLDIGAWIHDHSPLHLHLHHRHGEGSAPPEPEGTRQDP
jgi:hypothetical protein